MEDYKQKYEEALENIKRIKAANKDNKELVDFIEYKYPELKESEDERIRKEIARYFKNYSGGDDISVKFPKWIAWLEKQDEQNIKMIQWNGDNLHEVVEFTGKSPKFNEWFKTWDDYESYVHEHNNIFKLFDNDGNHWEVPVGAWIVKTPDGYNVASKAKYKQNIEKKELKKIEQKPEIKDDVLSRFAFYQYDDDTIYLSSLFVRDSDRGHGYGSKVLKAAEEVAKTFGISKIRLKVERNTLTEKWYEKNGYKYLSSEGKYDWLENRVIDIKPDKIEQNSNGDNCKIFDCDKVDMTEYNKGYECGKQRVLKYPEDFGLCKQSTWSEEDEAYYNFLNKVLTVNHPNAMFSANGNSYFDSDVSEKQIEQWLKSLKERMKGE